jgi:hypothetical protein
MFGSVDLVYPDGKLGRSKRGIQMGTPFGFSTLCMFHKFAVFEAGGAGSLYLIRGDDLIGVFQYPERYFGAMERLGFKINRQKTIVARRGDTFVATWKSVAPKPRA